MTILFADPLNIPAQLEVQWDDLSRNASEPNIFYERWMLIPAIKYLAKGERVRLLCILDDKDRNLMLALIPIVTAASYRCLPLRHIEVWKYLHCYLCTPLIRNGHENAALENILASVEDAQGRFLVFPYFHNGGPIAKSMTETFKNRALSLDLLEFHERPHFDATQDPEICLKASMSSMHRNDLRRKYRKLEREGEVLMELLWDTTGLDAWMNEFLALESSGWKGNSGSALALSEMDREFFSEIVKGAASSGSLLRASLRLNGVPVAMKCLFISGDTAFCWKIAYDQKYSRCSPGALLFIEIMHALGNSKTSIRLVDSCAVQNHSLLSRLWHERRSIRSLGVSKSSRASRFIVSGLSSLVQLKRTITPPRAGHTIDKHAYT